MVTPGCGDAGLWGRRPDTQPMLALPTPGPQQGAGLHPGQEQPALCWHEHLHQHLHRRPQPVRACHPPGACRHPALRPPARLGSPGPAGGPGASGAHSGGVGGAGLVRHWVSLWTPLWVASGPLESGSKGTTACSLCLQSELGRGLQAGWVEAGREGSPASGLWVETDEGQSGTLRSTDPVRGREALGGSEELGPGPSRHLACEAAGEPGQDWAHVGKGPHLGQTSWARQTASAEGLAVRLGVLRRPLWEDLAGLGQGWVSGAVDTGFSLCLV